MQCVLKFSVVVFMSKVVKKELAEVSNKFIKFKRNLFSHKRKTLSNLLKNYNFNKDIFDLKLRVEEISLQQLLKIFREINL